MKEYGFTENIDFVSLSQNCEKPQGGRPKVNYAIKLDMAKEIAMIQRNDKKGYTSFKKKKCYEIRNLKRNKYIKL